MLLALLVNPFFFSFLFGPFKVKTKVWTLVLLMMWAVPCHFSKQWVGGQRNTLIGWWLFDRGSGFYNHFAFVIFHAIYCGTHHVQQHLANWHLNTNKFLEVLHSQSVGLSNARNWSIAMYKLLVAETDCLGIWRRICYGHQSSRLC